MLDTQKGMGHRHQLKFALSGLSSKDLEQPSVAAARQVLRALRHNKQHLSTALLDVLTGTESVPKHAARCRLQLAEFAVLECLCQQRLIQVLPKLSQQANVVLAAHRQDAGCINSLAALLTSCVAKLLLEPQGSYAAIHGRATAPDSTEAITADYLCEALLFTVIKSTYRDPEQTRVSAGSVVLLALFEVLKGHTDQPAVLEAVRRCLGLMLQLMAAGTVAQRAPGVLLPVCSCVEVLGLSLDKDSTRRLIKLALKAATVQHSWQVRRDACQALATLAASLQFRTLPALDDGSPAAAAAQPELVLTPAVELLIAHKPAVLQVLDDVRYDKIAAVRATAAAAWAEFNSLPDPPAADDATPAGKSDREGGGSSSKLRGSSAREKGAGRKALRQRKRPPPPRFVRPKLLPDDERDFGVLVFAPPYPPPSQPSSPPPAEPADTSHEHGADQSPVARQLLFEAGTSTRASMDAASQTQVEPPGIQQQPYTVQSQLSAGSNPFFATSSSPSPGHSMGPEDLQQQLQQQLHHQLQQQQQPGLPALLAATGFGGSPVRLDISHHVHGRVEVGISYSTGGSPGPATQASTGPQPASPATTPAAGHAVPDGPSAAGAAAGLLSAMAAAAGQPGSPDVRHSLQTMHPLWDPQPEQQQWQQQQGAWATSSTEEMVFEPSFGQSGCAAASSNGAQAASLPVRTGLDVATAAEAHYAALSPADGSPEGLSPVAASPADVAHDKVLPGVQDSGHQAMETDLQEAFPQADSHSLTGQDGAQEHTRRQRQRQRWQLAPLSCPSEPDPEGSAPASRQCTPSEERTPWSPSSLEVLRNVGERVQHLLESINRQTSNSSRQGSRSSVASLPGRPLQGPPTQPGAPPVVRVARSISCLSSGSAASARTAGSASEGVEAIGQAGTVEVLLQEPEGQQQLHTLLQEKLASVDDQQTQAQEAYASSSSAANQQGWPAQVPQPVVLGSPSLQQQGESNSLAEPTQQQQQQQPLPDALLLEQRSHAPEPAAHQVVQGGWDNAIASAGPESPACASELATALQLQEQQQLELPASGVAMPNLPVDDGRPQQEVWQEQQPPSQLLQDGCSTPAANLPLDSLQLQGGDRGMAAAPALQQQQQDDWVVGADASTAGAAGCADANTAAAGVSSDSGRHPSNTNLQESSHTTPFLGAGSDSLRAAAATAAAAAAGQPQHVAIAATSDAFASMLGFAAAPSKLQCLSQSTSDDAEVDLVSTPRQQAVGLVSPRQALHQQQHQEEGAAVQQEPQWHKEQQQPVGVQQGLHWQEEQQECPAAQPTLLQHQVQQDAPAAPEPLLGLAPPPVPPSAEVASADQHTSWGPSAAGEATPQDLDLAVQQEQAEQTQQKAGRPPQHEAEGPQQQQQQQHKEQLQVASAAAAPPAGPGSFKVLYNELFQPCEAQHDDASAPTWQVSTLAPQDGQAAAAAGPAAPSPGAMLDGPAGNLPLAAAPAQAEAGGMSRVDKALEKLNSLRSTLRTISSSGCEPSSLPASARASLAGSRTVSTVLGTREHSTSSLALPAAGHLGLLQERSMGGSLTGITAAPASAVLQAPAGTSVALASAKDWIREISERLQHVGVGEAVPAAAVPTAAVPAVPAAAVPAPVAAAPAPAQASQPGQAVLQSPSRTQEVGPGAALQAMGCMELTPAAEAVQAMAGAGVQALAMAGAADGGAGAEALGSNFQAAPVPAEQPTATAALPSSQVLDSSSAPEPTQAAAAAVGRLVAADGLPVSPGIDAGHTTLLQESLTGSQGWSTLTAGSSSGSVGSEQLSNLVQEQLQASHSPRPEVAALPVAASAGAVDFPDLARPVTGLETDAGEPAAPAQGLASHQAREVQLEHQLADGSTEVAVVQQQAYSTAGQIGGMQPGQPEAVDNGAAGALLAPADEVAAALVTSEQRLQQLLSQDDDAVLLMSFALKLDRLGRTYKGPSQGLLSQGGGNAGGGANSLMQLAAASPGGLWQAPNDQCPSPGSPIGPASPAGPWTMVAHNSLYNSSATSTPQKPLFSRVPSAIRASAAVGATAVDVQASAAAHSSEPGVETAGSSSPGTALTQWGSQSVVADEAQLHDSVLRSVLGTTLLQLQEGADEAVRTVKSVLANLQQQGLASLPDWQLQHSAGASSNSLGMPPGLLALREDLRLEFRQQCSAQLREHVIRLPMCGVEGFAALLAIQEHAFLARVCPLVHNLALLP